MASDFGQWERVAAELRACREAQQRTWGDVDNATLGRYLAGDVTPEERRRIDVALHEHPELRSLTALVSDVLSDGAAAHPAVLPFRAASPTLKSKAGRWRRLAAVAAAACLLLGLGTVVLPSGVLPRTTAPSGGVAALSPSAPVRGTVAYHSSMRPGDSELMDKTLSASTSTTPVFDHVTLAFADGLSTAGSSYQKHGDLDLAEFAYKLSYNLREWKLGPDAPAAVETRRDLGDIYETALVLADEPAADAPAPPAQAVKLPEAFAVADAAKRKEMDVRNSAAQLRDRINRQAVRELRRSVAPALVQNLEEAKTPEARQQLGRALAELGPAAQDAAPQLEECLKQARTPQERAVVLRALGELGPTGGPAVVSALKDGSPDEQRAAADALIRYGPAARDMVLNMPAGATADRPEWRSLRERLQGAEGRIGVRDGCELFSLAALKQGQKEIRELARTARVEVYAETRPNAPKDDEAQADKDRAREIDANGVYFVIHPSPVSVDLYVGQALRGEGFDEGQLRQAVEGPAGRQDFDQGLLDGVRFVARFKAEKDKGATPAAPPKP